MSVIYLHGLVTVSKVVDDGERLLEAGAASKGHIGNQLANSNNDLLGKKEKEEEENNKKNFSG